MWIVTGLLKTLYTSQASAASSFLKLPAFLLHASLGWLSSRSGCTPYVPASTWSGHNVRLASFSVRRHIYLCSRYEVRSTAVLMSGRGLSGLRTFTTLCLSEHPAPLLLLTAGRWQYLLTRAQNLNSLGSLPFPAQSPPAKCEKQMC